MFKQQQQIAMFIAMFKTQMKPRVVSMQSFEHFDVIAMVDKSTDHWKVAVILLFLFTITLTGLKFQFFGKMHAREKEIQIVPPSRHFHGLYSYRLQLSNLVPRVSLSLSTTDQRARNHSVIVKYVTASSFCPTKYMFLKFCCYGQYDHNNFCGCKNSANNIFS